MLFKFQWQTEKLQQELLFLGPGLSSMSPHAISIRNATTKRIPKRKPEERPTTRNEFKLINLVLCVRLCVATRFIKRRK